MTDIDPRPHTDQPRDEALAAELDSLQRRIEALRSELDRTRPAGDGDGAAEAPPGADATTGRATSRRHLLHLAGASAVGALGGAVAAGRPAAAAAADPVLKSVPNVVTDTTTLDGTFPGPVLSLFNRSGADTARALYAYTEGASPAVRADNNGDVAAVGVAGNAPAGVDLQAFGSGRIAMEDHAFGGGNEYTAGELHQSGGTFYAMVDDAFRRVIAAPEAAGALFAIDPIRVYDSRVPVPFFGRIAAGQSRTVDINDSRDRDTGDVVAAGVVPEDATAVVYNLTVAQTAGRGFLSVTPDTTTDPDTSTINWWADDLVLANSSMVRIGVASSLAVYCGGTGSTHFLIDVVGYHR